MQEVWHANLAALAHGFSQTARPLCPWQKTPTLYPVLDRSAWQYSVGKTVKWQNIQSEDEQTRVR